MTSDLKFLVVSFALFALCTVGNCQRCNISLIFPLEAESRTIVLARVTTVAKVNVAFDCTEGFTSQVDATLMFNDPDGILTSSADVTLSVNLANTRYASSDIIFNEKVGTDPETITVTLSTSTADVTVLNGFDVLTFNRQNISEVSFDTSLTYQSAIGENVTVFVQRSIPRRNQESLMIDEFVALDMRRRLSGLPALVTFAEEQSTVPIVIPIAHDDPLVQAIVNVNFVSSSLSSGLISTRDPETRSLVINIVSPPVLSTKIHAIGIPATSSSVLFAVVSSRRVDYDITIALTYTGDFEIVSNRRQSLILPAGEDEVDVIFPISPLGANVFVVEIDAAVVQAFINQEKKTTTYRIEAPTVFISISERDFTASEGDFVVTSLVTTIPAPFSITVDVYTPLPTDAEEISFTVDPVAIPAGESRANVTIRIVEDGIEEQPQVVTVVFQSLTPGAVVERNADSVEIRILASTDSGVGIIPPVLNPDSMDDDQTISNGAVAGIIIAVLVLFLVVGAFCCLFAFCLLSPGFGRF